MDTTRMWPIRNYVRRRQETITEYLSGRPIYEIYTGAERMDGSSQFLRWWYQYHGPNKIERELE